MNLVGQHVGNYVVVRQLGAGGMGTVYLAEHPALNRKVAIKVLHDEHTNDADLVSRFFQEARAAAAIGEEHIIDVIDAGELAVGDRKANYLMMELLDGKSLGKRIEQGPIPPDEVAHIILQVCMALSASHAKGIIHRDLKPENIYLCPRGHEPEFVKVLDFGIAKLTGSAKASGSKATRIGTVLGTPAYMSPEQCVGILDIDPRADIYALGVVMYEMLTGRLPFDGEIGELIDAHLRRVPAPPSTRNPAVPPAWDAIVMHCLEKARDNRFASMAEVEAAVRDPDAHLAAYQQQVAARQAEIAGHRTAVMPPELRPDHRAAVAAGLAVDVEPTPVPFMYTRTPTPAPAQIAQGTPAPFMVVPPRSRTPLLVAIAASVVVAGTLIAIGLTRRPQAPAVQPPPSVPTVTVPVDAAVDAAVDAPVPDAAIEVPAMVHLSITTTPPGAKVVVQRGDEVWTASSIELTLTDAPVTVTVSAPGYKTVTQTLTPRKDAEIVIVLPAAPTVRKSPRTPHSDDLIRP